MADETITPKDTLFSGDAIWLEVPVIDRCCWADPSGKRCTDELDRHVVIVRADKTVQHVSFCFGHFEAYRAQASAAGWRPMIDVPAPQYERAHESSAPHGHVDGVPRSLMRPFSMTMLRRQR